MFSIRKVDICSEGYLYPFLLLDRLILNSSDDIAVENIYGAALSTIKPVNIMRRSALYR
jgi:hypothetical protein